MLPSDLETILGRVPEDVAAKARELVGVLATIRPDLAAKVQQGWGSINFRHKTAGFVCAVFPLADHVSLIFEQGRLLSNDHGLLQGDGKQVRFIRIDPQGKIPEGPIGLLLAEAIALRS